MMKKDQMAEKNGINEAGLARISEFFSAMMTITPEQSPDILRNLAQNENLPLLQAILASGVIKADSQYRAPLAAAIAPLLIPGEIDPVREAFASDWLKALDLDTPTKLGVVLPEVERTWELRDLIRVFGADPLAVVPYSNGDRPNDWTALGQALFAGETAKVQEMLLALIEQGRGPIAGYTEKEPISLFEVMLEQGSGSTLFASNVRSTSATVMEQISREAVPEEWERMAGRALLNSRDNRNSLDNQTENVMVQMLGIARFDDPNLWLRIMGAGDPNIGVATTLLTKQKQNLALRVIANMKRDGASPDALVARHRTGTSVVTMPWLHAAAAADRVEIVEALLDAGSKPSRATHMRQDAGPVPPVAVERDALDVAKPGSASEKMIHAWKAKHAIGSIIENALAGKARP